MDSFTNPENLIKDLLTAQLFGVLNTWGGKSPYSNLVAFAADQNLRSLYFATIRSTQKYRNITLHPDISLLVDNRSNKESDLRNAIAVTCQGWAQETSGTERENGLKIYLKKHPALKSLIEEPDCALIRIIVSGYILAGFSKTAYYDIST